MGLVRSFFRLIRLFLITGLFLILLLAGMSLGGFYLLKYMVTGETVIVPSVYGKNEMEAIKILVEHNLSFVIGEPESRMDVEPGLVVSQRPAPGQEVKLNRPITLTLSKGQEVVFIPDFTQRPLAAIRSDLRSAGLEIGQKAMVYHPTAPSDVVVAQEPLSGRWIVQNKRVNLLVSRGPRSIGYIMPNLIGMDLDTVKKRIASESFNLPEENIHFERVTDISKWFRIIRQVPEPGARMQEDDSIHITIGTSGVEISDLRTVDINFPIPETAPRDRLFLLVWDDISSVSTQFGHPTKIPLEPLLWENVIRRTIPVMGDALVSLCVDSEFPDISIHQTFFTQYFPSSSSKSKNQ